MSIIENLFSRSPFTPLQTHMEKVADCVDQLEILYQKFTNREYDEVNKIVEKISELEHSADLTKNDIRNNLPRGLFLAINRSDLLQILSLQDSIADTAEDLAILVTIKKLKPFEELNEKLSIFLNKNIEAVKKAHLILQELEQLLQTTFSRSEASKIKQMIHDVAYLEHESDVLQREILKILYNLDDKMKYSDFHLWLNIIKAIAALGDISERLANKISMLLETS